MSNPICQLNVPHNLYCPIVIPFVAINIELFNHVSCSKYALVPFLVRLHTLLEHEAQIEH